VVRTILNMTVVMSRNVFLIDFIAAWAIGRWSTNLVLDCVIGLNNMCSSVANSYKVLLQFSAS